MSEGDDYRSGNQRDNNQPGHIDARCFCRRPRCGVAHATAFYFPDFARVYRLGGLDKNPMLNVQEVKPSPGSVYVSSSVAAADWKYGRTVAGFWQPTCA